MVDDLRGALGDILVAEDQADRSWYKTGSPDILIATEDSEEVRPLSDYSPVIKQLKDAPHRQVRLYALPERAAEGRQIADQIRRN